MRALTRAQLVLRRDATLGSIMERLAAIHGGERLVSEAATGAELTYRDAADRVARLAGAVAGRIDTGDRVVLATANNYDTFLLCQAVSRAGGIPVPVNPLMRTEEIDHVVADSGATTVWRSADEVGLAEPLADPGARPDDVAVLFYTSGTTGRPKGAEVTHRAVIGLAAAAAAWPYRLRRDEAVFSLPIAHIMGFVVLVTYACAGVPCYLFERFRPDEVLDAIERRRATVFIGVPAMYRMMLEAGAADRDLSSIRLWGSGADAMPTDLARRFKQLGATATLPLLGPVGEAIFAEGYGMVETAGGVAAKISPPLLDVGLGDSVGFSLPGYRLRVVDEAGREVPPGVVGELQVRGPGVMRGYWGAPEASAGVVTDEGWLRTGDVARRGPLGMVVFVGRSKDVIMHGGYSVYAREVQDALEEHPGVAEAVVLGLPDERLGEVPVAVVRASDPDLDEGQLVSWAAERLADYKAPRRVVLVDDFARTGTQKVQRADLLALFG